MNIYKANYSFLSYMNIYWFEINFNNNFDIQINVISTRQNITTVITENHIQNS